MSCRATLAQLSTVISATPFNLSNATATLATGITTDTRSLKPGEIFLALRGEIFDGHSFVSGAIEKGAIAAIVDSKFSISEAQNLSFPLLQVPDTLQAYQTIARWWRDQFSIPVIAVTGSVGKTTTKELIAAVLSYPTPDSRLPTPPSSKARQTTTTRLGFLRLCWN